MLEAGARLLLAGVLVVAAALKLAGPRSSQATLGTFGIGSVATRWLVWGAIVGAELVLAVSVALGSAVAAYAAAGMLVAFAAAMAAALARGKAGAPCGCFGSRSRLGKPAIARNLVLAAAFAATPWLPSPALTTAQWLGLGLALALAAILGLTVGLLALAREVGMLRLQLAPRGALEIPEEGPELGSRTDAIELLERKHGAELGLAVFFSGQCSVCTALKPAVEAFGRDPVVTLRVFEEGRDAEVWRDLGIPGSPFAVALDLEGTVLAKGTFNSPGQLESVLAAGERRVREAVYG